MITYPKIEAARNANPRNRLNHPDKFFDIFHMPSAMRLIAKRLGRTNTKKIKSGDLSNIEQIKKS
jgi:hypothetical protein